MLRSPVPTSSASGTGTASPAEQDGVKRSLTHLVQQLQGGSHESKP